MHIGQGPGPGPGPGPYGQAPPGHPEHPAYPGHPAPLQHQPSAAGGLHQAFQVRSIIECGLEHNTTLKSHGTPYLPPTLAQNMSVSGPGYGQQQGAPPLQHQPSL